MNLIVGLVVYMSIAVSAGVGIFDTMIFFVSCVSRWNSDSSFGVTDVFVVTTLADVHFNREVVV